MAYSLQRAISDGTLNTIPVSIKYFDKTDVSVFVDDVLLPNGTYTYVWSANNIVITPNVAAGLEVLIKRTTKFDTPYHDFSAGAVFKDSTVDDNFLQMLFIAQETSEGATQTDFYADLNFHGYRLRKVGNAIEPDDAVPFAQYRADALGAYQQRILAEAARDEARSAKQAAESARDTSVSAANSTAGSVSAAAASASQAAASASTALGYRNEAETFKNAASASATNASNSATKAASSAAAAATSAASINDANLVHKTGTESIGGLKTFTSTLTVSNGDIVATGYGGNSAAGRVSLNAAKTAYIGSDGTNVTIEAGGNNKVNIPFLRIPAVGGEGGEMHFGVAQTSSLVGGVNVDMDNVNRFRIFENAGTNRGVYLDLGDAPAGTVGKLMHSHIAGDQVGQLVWAQQVAGARCDFNQSTAGSNLRVACAGAVSAIALNGTWRSLSQLTTVSGGFHSGACGLWIKVA